MAALAPGHRWFGGALVVVGAASLAFTNGTNSMMQLSTEPAMRGSVMALDVGIALAGSPIGAPIVGWVRNHFRIYLPSDIFVSGGVVELNLQESSVRIDQRGSGNNFDLP